LGSAFAVDGEVPVPNSTSGTSSSPTQVLTTPSEFTQASTGGARVPACSCLDVANSHPLGAEGPNLP